MLTEGITAFAYNGSTFLALILLQIWKMASRSFQQCALCLFSKEVIQLKQSFSTYRTKTRTCTSYPASYKLYDNRSKTSICFLCTCINQTQFTNIFLEKKVYLFKLFLSMIISTSISLVCLCTETCQQEHGNKYHSFLINFFHLLLSHFP